MLATLFFIALACFRGFPLSTIDLLATGTAASFFFGNFALLRLANPRIGERVRARVTLLIGQRAQHDA